MPDSVHGIAMTEEDGRHQVCHSRASLLLRAELYQGSWFCPITLIQPMPKNPRRRFGGVLAMLSKRTS
jgi:hypothetical protein